MSRLLRSLFLFLLWPALLWASSHGPHAPDACVSGGQWTNCGNVTASDDAWAVYSYGSSGGYQDGMNITIPFTTSDFPAGCAYDSVVGNIEGHCHNAENGPQGGKGCVLQQFMGDAPEHYFPT